MANSGKWATEAFGSHPPAKNIFNLGNVLINQNRAKKFYHVVDEYLVPFKSNDSLFLDKTYYLKMKDPNIYIILTYKGYYPNDRLLRFKYISYYVTLSMDIFNEYVKKGRVFKQYEQYISYPKNIKPAFGSMPRLNIQLPSPVLPQVQVFHSPPGMQSRNALRHPTHVNTKKVMNAMKLGRPRGGHSRRNKMIRHRTRSNRHK
jgi:hypothetical protein